MVAICLIGFGIWACVAGHVVLGIALILLVALCVDAR